MGWWEQIQNPKRINKTKRSYGQGLLGLPPIISIKPKVSSKAKRTSENGEKTDSSVSKPEYKVARYLVCNKCGHKRMLDSHVMKVLGKSFGLIDRPVDLSMLHKHLNKLACSKCSTKSLVIKITEPQLINANMRKKSVKNVQRIAQLRRSKATFAERKMEEILNDLNNGVLQGRFVREWAFGGQFILDFFFHEVRLGIEVDGGYHETTEQKALDKKKEVALRSLDITLLRVKNSEVFGDRKQLVDKLRAAWKSAKLSHP